MKKNFLLVLIFLFALSAKSFSAGVQDSILLDGAEPLYRFGMDTTVNWWAITQPFSERFRLIVNGKKSDVYQKISAPVFSFDGEKWATFVQSNTQWLLMTQDSLIQTNLDVNSSPGEIIFSPNSRVLAYSVKQNNEEIIRFGSRTIRTNFRQSDLFLNQAGTKIAFTVQRGERISLAVNAQEIAIFDEIKPIGFFYDDTFLYAARNGEQWQIYRNSEEITPGFISVSQGKMNLGGTVAAALVTLPNGKSTGYLFSDEYTEPLSGQLYDEVNNLALHPHIALYAYNASRNGAQFVIQGTAEYSGGYETGPPKYSYDGKELFFAGSDTEMFMNVNGKKFPLRSQIPVTEKFSFLPGKNILAYCTSATLVVRSLEFDKISMGKMCDETISPRYNWRKGEFEALGRQSDRLYLMHGKI